MSLRSTSQRRIFNRTRLALEVGSKGWSWESISNKLVGNGFDWVSDRFGDKDFGKYSLLIPKQIGGALGGQMIANFIKRVQPNSDFGKDDLWEGAGASYGRDYWKLLKTF